MSIKFVLKKKEEDALKKSGVYSFLCEHREVRDLFYELWKKYDGGSPAATFESALREFSEILFHPALNALRKREMQSTRCHFLLKMLRNKIGELNSLLDEYDENDIVVLVCLCICCILQERNHRIKQ